MEGQPKKPVIVPREDLYKQVWEKPMQRLAAEYGISGNGLAKICDKLNVPYPSRGYWAKREAGKPVKQTPLPAQGMNTPADVRIAPTPPRLPPSPPPTMSPEVQESYDAAMERAKSIAVPDALRRPHAIIAAWVAERAREVAAAKRDRFRGAFAPKPLTAVDRRRHRILDTLFKELEKRSFRVKAERYGEPWLEVGRERVEFMLYERIRQVRRPVSPEQGADPLYSRQRWTQEKVPTGMLICRIKMHLAVGLTHEWSDQEDKPPEANIADIVATLNLAGPLLKKQREVKEEQERERMEADRRRSEEAARQKRDHNRCRKFLNMAQQWREVQTASEFLSVLEADATVEGRFGDRSHALVWMRRQLEIYDPLKVGPAGIWQDIAAVTQWSDG